MASQKEKYQSFTDYEYVPLFYRDWYLDAVCDGDWDVAIYEEEGEVLGTWAYMIKRKIGVSYLIHPQLCPYMGPLFHGFVDIPKTYQELISMLPSHQLLIQDFYHATPHISTQERGKDKYTYVISSDSNMDELAISSSRKRDIKKAKAETSISYENDFELFFSFLEKSFVDRGLSNPYPHKLFQKLDSQLEKQNNRQILKCIDSDGTVLSYLYLMNDEKWVYNFCNATDRSIKQNNGVSVLLHSAIEMALKQNKSFDFEGSVIPGVEKFYQSLGGVKMNYQSVYQSKNSLIDLIVKLKNPTAIPK